MAKEIELSDPYENMGAQMVREVASRTSDTAGDGTTTATVLAEAVYREGLKNVAAGANPVYLKRGIDSAVSAAVGALEKLSKKVRDREEIRQVATVSANWDNEIGEIIADAMDKVGKDGTITVEEAKSHPVQGGGVSLQRREHSECDRQAEALSGWRVAANERGGLRSSDPRHIPGAINRGQLQEF